MLGVSPFFGQPHALQAVKAGLMGFQCGPVDPAQEELFEEFCRVDESCTGMVEISNWLEASSQDGIHHIFQKFPKSWGYPLVIHLESFG